MLQLGAKAMRDLARKKLQAQGTLPFPGMAAKLYGEEKLEEQEKSRVASMELAPLRPDGPDCAGTLALYMPLARCDFQSDTVAG